MEEPITVVNDNMSIINKKAEEQEKEMKEEIRQSKLRKAREKYGKTN